jgi:hypothetical protein
MKPPMNTKMTGSAKEASAGRTAAMPNNTARTGPISAVTASGSASVTQKTMTIPRIAASRCAGCGTGSGAMNRTRKTSGPRTSPMFRRRALNRSSAGE